MTPKLTEFGICHGGRANCNAGFTGAVTGWAVFAFGTAMVALALIFGLDPGAMWPVFFIIAGAAAILATWR
jgi:hypothetical protein